MRSAASRPDSTYAKQSRQRPNTMSPRMNVCRMTLHHTDGRVEETEVRGDGTIVPGSFWRLGRDSTQWGDVGRVRWWGPGGVGDAELEPAELPPHLASLEPPLR